jgi:uncharacterized protein involved in outer membrane biogenesis
MNKVFSGIFALIVIVIIAAVLVVFFGWSRIPDMLAGRLSDKLQVHVAIDDVNLSMNSINIQKIEVGNPSGYTLSKAFSAEQILISAPITTYLHKEVVIERLDIDNIYLGLEFNKQGSKKGNWSTLMANLKASEASSSSDKTVLIRKLVLTNISITLAYSDGSKPPKKLSRIPRLEFDNVSSEHGIPTEQISEIIMREMLKSIFSLEGIQNMLEGFLESPQKGIQNLLKPFGDLIP